MCRRRHLYSSGLAKRIRPQRGKKKSFDRFLQVWESRAFRVAAVLGLCFWLMGYLGHEAITQYESLRLQIVHASEITKPTATESPHDAASLSKR